MTRVRTALLLVAGTTLALVAVLAWRAYAGLSVERTVRHAAIAERAFEEMERFLTLFLEEEEERPFEHYRFYVSTTGERSPLAQPATPFVVGAFTLGPDGSVTTPLEPRDLALARSRGDWPPPDAVAIATERVRNTVNALWSANRPTAAPELATDPAPREDATLTQAPGTTRVLSGPGVHESLEEALAPVERDVKKEASQNTFDVLGRLNTSADARQERRQKVAEAPSDAFYGGRPQVLAQKSAPAPASEPRPARERVDADRSAVPTLADEAPTAVAKSAVPAEAPTAVATSAVPAEAPTAVATSAVPAEAPTPDAASRLAESEAEPTSSLDLVETAASGATPEAGGDALAVSDAAPEAASAGGVPETPVGRTSMLRALGYEVDPPPAVAPSPSGPGEAAPAGTVQITLDPMVGTATGDVLVLHRTVWVDRGAYRQGLVLDRAALGSWLEERVIGARGLAAVASLHFGEAPPLASPAAYRFAHRFAEPFDAVSAELRLQPLPGVASPTPLYALVGVLLLVGAGGLFAIDRSATAALQYAERRGNFVAAVTHELKTPLTAIRMYAEMLRDGLVSDDAKRREYYGTITDESERLSRLVDNVLEFSKLEGGRRDLSVHVGPVGPVLEEAAEKLRAHAEREGFGLRVRVAPNLAAVGFDRDALLQVLFNLVDNAMKYARGAERREVEIAATEADGSVWVAVRDYGPGVARAQLEQVFEPFYRGGDELTRSTKGTGIGLALVKELSERMGASVSGANASDGGFEVRLGFPKPA